MANPETLIIDVRPDSMREELGYFECSTQLVYSEMKPSAFYEGVTILVDHEMDHPIFIYYTSGQYAMTVQQVISDVGFTNVRDGGSYEDLIESGCTCLTPIPTPEPTSIFCLIKSFILYK